MKLPLRPFGSTGFQVSPIGLGTVKIGRNQKVKYAPYPLPSDEEVIALLETATECGINLIDTAPAYGIAEERLGKLLGNLREQFHIFTKVGEIFREGTSHYDFSRAAVEASITESLRRLRTDRLESVLLHCDSSDVATILHSPALDVLAERKRQGDILSYGISTMTLEGGLLAAERADAVMVAFNAGYDAEKPAIEAAAARGKGILIKKGLLSGNLGSLPVRMNPLEQCIQAVLELPGKPVLVAGTLSPKHLRQNADLAAAILGRDSTA